ncbi:uncharacterized protein [Populus alba]|uniref:uncharacterized protein isoform X2 n=1 Tax=Populus alba TaxID=43335 RepID=UPI003CC71E23
MEEGKSGEKKKVMVAIDESENSHYTLEWTLDKLRETIADSDVIIFTAQPNSDLGYVYASSFGAAPVDLITSIQENHKKVASLLLDKAKDICAKYGGFSGKCQQLLCAKRQVPCSCCEETCSLRTSPSYCCYHVKQKAEFWI